MLPKSQRWLSDWSFLTFLKIFPKTAIIAVLSVRSTLTGYTVLIRGILLIYA